jgi:hypothetical protein
MVEISMKNLYIIFIIFIIFIILITNTRIAIAAEFDYEHIFQSSLLNTSDDLSSTRLAIVAYSPRADLNWPFQNEVDNGACWVPRVLIGDNRSAKKSLNFYEGAISRFTKLSSSFAFNLEMGSTLIRTTGATDKNSPLLSGKVQMNHQGLFAELEASKKNAVSTIYSMDTEIYKTDITSLKPRISWRAHEKLNLKYKSEHNWYSDKNRSNQFEIAAMYGISTGEPWLWLGPSSHFIAFEKVSPYLWSPEKFQDFGLSADMAWRLSEDIQTLLGGTLYQMRENSKPPGTGHYLNAGLIVGSRETRKFMISFESVKSEQNGLTWTSLALNISYFGQLDF